MKSLCVILFCIVLGFQSLHAGEFLQIETGGKWLMWFPDQPKRSDIETQGYAGVTINARLNYKNFIRLYNLKYEFSNGIQAPTVKGRDELIKDKAGTAGYILFHLLSDFMIPQLPYNAGLIFRANYEDYRAVVHFKDYVRYIPYNYNEIRKIYSYNSGDKAEFYTRFNDFFCGVSFGNPPGTGNYGRFFAGMGKTLYQKPYTFRIGTQELEDTITDTRFEGVFFGVGIVGQFILNSNDILYTTAAWHVGAGDMVLVKDRVDITQIAENNKSDISYMGLELSAEYKRNIIPNKVQTGLEADFKIKSFDLLTPGTTVETAPNMNQDIFLGLKFNVGYLF
ncbi:MAG TPA: hypothetical protein ENO01_03295 [Candidatus Marinimicrobia bacterium]|nr:hypothetical protein [Candidatus Neomarinimicrobiota bacterium]